MKLAFWAFFAQLEGTMLVCP